LETLKDLERHGIHAIGVGRRVREAHQPAIVRAGEHAVGLLGYYWNRRTAARGKLPGSAMDTPDSLANDITRLRALVDRVVVTVHWGVPYDRQPSPADQEKARLMISLGADIVIGHHPHIIQQVEIFKNRPIFYSIGNFAFGTGNSHAESMVLGVDFQSSQTVVDLFPAYARNRDPRINYQPKIMTGAISERALEHLRSLSPDGQLIRIADGIGRLTVPLRIQ
jgi:poly-gamma-glutamate capsule biosynthesis protein CapA/YwtB (metallophosphatase superfamily)